MTEIEPTNQEQINVAFIELELINENIQEWFPLVEKQCICELPNYDSLEGGLVQNKDGTITSVWKGSHYYLCIPEVNINLLQPYGKIYTSTIKQVNKNQMNKDHSIYYWGPGCNPTLRPNN